MAHYFLSMLVVLISAVYVHGAILPKQKERILPSFCHLLTLFSGANFSEIQSLHLLYIFGCVLGHMLSFIFSSLRMSCISSSFRANLEVKLYLQF